MGIDFLAGFLFSLVGLGFILSIVPVYNITASDWYNVGKGFFQKWVLDTGMQFSSILPIKAVGEVTHIFVMYFFTPFILISVARLILNTIMGGGVRG